MSENSTNRHGWKTAAIIALGVAVLTGAVMIVLTRSGISPFPKPPSQAFAETLLGGAVPLPVGLLFHAAYVGFWSMLYLMFFANRSLKSALLLAGALWLVILAVIFPVVGWGFAGLSVSPRLIPASFVPHLLFGLLLWAGDAMLGRRAHSA